MRFSVLSSGSKANCTFFEGPSTRLLIDCGLSARQVELRLAALGIKADTLQGILVTHEHSDHIRGVPALSRKFRIPVYANAATAASLENCFALEKIRTGEPFPLNEIEVSPFSIVHDAAEPVGYTLRAAGLKFAQATDLGRVTSLVRDALREAHAIVLESNHDPEMLLTCSYPWELKQRISSSHGHLSNHVAAELLSELLHPELFHVVLGHLSENSNTPELALASARSALYEGDAPKLNLTTLLCGAISCSTPLLDLREPAVLEAVA